MFRTIGLPITFPPISFRLRIMSAHVVDFVVCKRLLSLLSYSLWSEYVARVFVVSKCCTTPLLALRCGWEAGQWTVLLLSLSACINPSARKRIRYSLANCDETNGQIYSEDGHECNLSTKPEVNYPRCIVPKPVSNHQSLMILLFCAVTKSIQGRFYTVNQSKWWKMVAC